MLPFNFLGSTVLGTYRDHYASCWTPLLPLVLAMIVLDAVTTFLLIIVIDYALFLAFVSLAL